MQDLAVIITQNSKIKNSLFVASSGGYECEKAIDESENTGGFHILFILFYTSYNNLFFQAWYSYSDRDYENWIQLNFNRWILIFFLLSHIYNTIHSIFANFRPIQVQQLELKNSVYLREKPRSVCTVQYIEERGSFVFQSWMQIGCRLIRKRLDKTSKNLLFIFIYKKYILSYIFSSG